MNTRLILIIPLIILFTISGCTGNEEGISDFNNPSPKNSKYPHLFSTGNTLYMSWISEDKNEISTLNYASYTGSEWSRPIEIASDSTWFVNWADFPSLIADENGPVAAHWLNKKPGGPYAYDVNVSVPDDDNSWQKAFVPHRDSTATEHGFVSMVPWNDESFLAVWLDGRQTANREDDEYFNIKYAMTLRGAIISKQGEIKKEFLIDDSVCDCCQTSLVKTQNGAMVAYRNRTDEEIRDIYFSRFDGEKWSKPLAIHNDNWKIGACPVNGPKLAADGPFVALAWHTGADNAPAAKIAISTNNGEDFQDPIQLNKQNSLGRVDTEIVDNNVYISWMEDSKAGNATLYLSSLSKENKLGTKLKVDDLNSSRKTGFPQLERLGNDLIFSWTNVDSSSTGITTKKVSVPL